jgi:hypothetical protein
MERDYFSFLSDVAKRQRDAIVAAPPVPEWRPCDECPKRAWLVDYDPFGEKTFQCGNGHLKVVAG